MTVIDMRNFFHDCDVELIEINDEVIYYAEEKVEEGHNSLFLLEYNRAEQQERIVANYILNDEAYNQHYFAFENDIIVLMENGKSLAWILRIDKKTGKEKNFEQINFIGNFLQCKALSQDHILVLTEENMEHRKLFTEYRSLTGLKHIAYLYDMEEKEYHYIKDERICESDCNCFIPYKIKGETQLLILQPYGTEREKEHCFKNKCWLGEDVCDKVWTCDLESLIYAARCEKEILMEVLFTADSNGMIRYIGMDGENMYFKAKHFPWNDLRLCAVEKETGKRFVVSPLTLKEGEREAEFWIDTVNMRGFHITKKEEELEIK
ncbi:MAG: hypothetical protein SOR71_06460, partial [Oscillospiraceae bacterium]|nr:hypothetical protein [Oscillospiraceae bacterium]